MVDYYHGGARGRDRGAFILPPAITGARTMADFGAAAVCRRDRVYVTTDINAALLYASGVPKGVIYEVEPIGELEADPDCNMPGLSYQCARARVKRVIKPSHWDIHGARKVMAGAA